MSALIAIVAGGASRRMGSDKASQVIGSRTMLEAVAMAAAPAGEVIVVGGEHGGEWPLLQDARPGRKGPIAGLEAALDHAAGRDVALVAVDQPFLRTETLQHLLATDGDAVVPVDDGWEQTTCAVYRPPCLAVARTILDSDTDLSLRSLVAAVDARRVESSEWRSWGEDGRSWYSVDTHQALDEGLRRYGAPS